MIPVRHLIAAWLRTVIHRRKPETPVNPDSTAVDDISERVAACAATVANAIGSGLPEVVYENALAHELRKAGFAVCQQQTVAVYCDGVIVGDYTADLLVENTILVELKAVRMRSAFDTAQRMRYLHATGITRSLRVNFGNPRLPIRRLNSGR
jgi:GxxExxY protein